MTLRSKRRNSGSPYLENMSATERSAAVQAAAERAAGRRAAEDRARARQLAAAQAADARAAAERAARSRTEHQARARRRVVAMPALLGLRLDRAMDVAAEAGLTGVTVCRTPGGWKVVEGR